jgi:hypothetical protein
VFLASNQLYFDYAAGQPPGDLSAVGFFDLRLRGLLQEVFMGPQTLSSWWTELFARLWFDYERRFFPVANSAMALGRTMYALGLAAVLTVVGGLSARAWKRQFERRDVALLAILLGFLAVPLVQTLRYPVYSSMKAAFILPAAPIMGLALCWGIEGLGTTRAARWWSVLLVALLLVWGLAHGVAAVAFNTEAMSAGLSGPLWGLPAVPR